MRESDAGTAVAPSRRRPSRSRLLLGCAVLLLVHAPGRCQTHEALAGEVRRTEVAFAKTMADRDLAAFTRFVADEAVFVYGQDVLRGRAQVVGGWKQYFEGPAPFSWEPEQVVVLDSRKLALSSGPVRDPDGKRVGTFNSVWRREKDGRWRIVLDNGCPRCECGGAPAGGNP